jgi:hypothetical protein
VLRHGVIGGLELLDDRAHDADQVGAGGGQVRLLADLLEERDAGVLFELLDLA